MDCRYSWRKAPDDRVESVSPGGSRNNGNARGLAVAGILGPLSFSCVACEPIGLRSARSGPGTRFSTSASETGRQALVLAYLWQRRSVHSASLQKPDNDMQTMTV